MADETEPTKGQDEPIDDPRAALERLAALRKAIERAIQGEDEQDEEEDEDEEGPEPSDSD